MLDNLKEYFKEGLGYTHTAGILQQLANLVNIVHVQYTKDSDAKNAAIDVICALLQSHKDVPVEQKTIESLEVPNASS
jgi:hypothetical protein